MQHSKDVLNVILGVVCEFSDFETEMETVRRVPQRRKQALRAYRQRVVMPKARDREIKWFQEKLAGLNDEGLIHYAELVPLRTPWRASMRWAAWGPCLWRFFKAWCVARAVGGVPLAVWGRGGVPKVMARCPACGSVLVGLRHMIEECPATATYRRCLPEDARPVTLRWALMGCADVNVLRLKIRFFGLSVARLVHEAERSGEESAVEIGG
jgi:hypothetical protein